VTIEEKLRSAPLTAPSRRLDRSVEETIRWFEISSESAGKRAKPYWFAAAGLAVGLVVGLLLGGLVWQPPPSATGETITVYVVEPTPELESWIQASAAERTPSFFQRSHDELETVFESGRRTSSNPNDL